MVKSKAMFSLLQWRNAKDDQRKPELSILDGDLIITDASGNFRVSIKKQKAGTKIIVKMKDYYNLTNENEETVTVIDKTNPVVSKVDTVYQTSRVITGKVKVMQ